MQERAVICYSCGRELELAMGRLPCEQLDGWIMVSWLKGREAVDQYRFCSVDCLRDWLNSQITKVPDAFLKSFDEEERNG